MKKGLKGQMDRLLRKFKEMKEKFCFSKRREKNQLLKVYVILKMKRKIKSYFKCIQIYTKFQGIDRILIQIHD